MYHMTEEQIADIRTMYRSGTEIYQLAELNACENKVIKEIVADIVRPKRIVKREYTGGFKNRTPAEMEAIKAEAIIHYRNGDTDQEISRKLKWSQSSVSKWRNGLGLPINFCEHNERKRPRRRRDGNGLLSY